MARFDFFPNVHSRGMVCTKALFEHYTCSPALGRLLQQIAAEKDDEARAKLKKRLPVITWQAHFPHGRRKNADAQPSGLFMVDIDHVADPKGLYEEKIKPLIKRPTPNPSRPTPSPSREGGESCAPAPERSEALPLTGSREGVFFPSLPCI